MYMCVCIYIYIYRCSILGEPKPNRSVLPPVVAVNTLHAQPASCGAAATAARLYT